MHDKTVAPFWPRIAGLETHESTKNYLSRSLRMPLFLWHSVLFVDRDFLWQYDVLEYSVDGFLCLLALCRRTVPPPSSVAEFAGLFLLLHEWTFEAQKCSRVKATSKAGTVKPSPVA